MLLNISDAYKIVVEIRLIGEYDIYYKCGCTYFHVYGGTRDENNGSWFGLLDLLAIRLEFLLITVNTALSLIYTIYSSPLHTHYDTQFPLVVS
jgi:hypothetical protein